MPAQAGTQRGGGGAGHPEGESAIIGAEPILKRQPTANRMKIPCVYILASRPNGTLYTGVTSDIVQRVWFHKNDLVDGFTKRYAVHNLVWYEVHELMESAIGREKAIKRWRRAWKVELIEKDNPFWADLYDDVY